MSATAAFDFPDTDDARNWAAAAWAVLGALALAIIVLLVLPVAVPIGAMYWDTFLYPDASHRIALGQVPNIDFFTPVGPLAYYLYHWTVTLLPDAHPLLAANWSIAIITIPAMALIVADMARHAPLSALAITVPFALFTLLPFNTTEYYTYPGIDGFGIYNRHASQLLYVLAATLLFVRNRTLQITLITTLMLALFLVKITGFAAAGLLCLVGLISGRVTLRTAIIVTMAFGLVLAALQAMTGIVVAYVGDILALLAINDASLTLRLIQGASRTSGTVIFAGLLALALVWLSPPVATREQPLWRAVTDHPVLWLAAGTVGGVAYEAQNTGSQELIHLWPIIVLAMQQTLVRHRAAPATAIIALLAACTIVPPLVQTIQHGARATLAMARQTPLVHDNLGPLGRVTVRDRFFQRADRVRAHFVAHRQATRALAMARELPAQVLYSEHDFQTNLLRNADDVVTRLNALRAQGLTFETIMTLDFANPFAWLLDADAPRHIAIGADPYRAVPRPDADVLAAIADTDIVLEPQCPYRDNARELLVLYRPALDDHVRVTVTPCYDAFVKPDLAPAFSG